MSRHDAQVSERVKTIVGLDPGNTVGISILGFDGSPLLVESYKNMGRSEAILKIAQYGDPTIVAADVPKAPEFVEEVARKFNAPIYSLPHPLPAIEKHFLAKHYARLHGLGLKDRHQRDSLVAAVKAFNAYRNKFQKAEAHLRSLGLGLSPDELKALIVRGFTISEAIELLKAKGHPEAPRNSVGVERGTVGPKGESAASLARRVERQAKVILTLKEACERLSAENTRLQARLESLKGALARERDEGYRLLRQQQAHLRLESEVQSLRHKVASLEEKLRRRDLETAEHPANLVRLVVLPSFTHKSIELADELGLITPGSLVYLRNASGGGSSTAKSLVEKRVRAVIVGSNPSHLALETFLSYGIPVVAARDIEITWVRDAAYAKREDLEKAISDSQALSFSEIAQKIERSVEEYRVGRSG